MKKSKIGQYAGDLAREEGRKAGLLVSYGFIFLGVNFLLAGWNNWFIITGIVGLLGFAGAAQNPYNKYSRIKSGQTAEKDVARELKKSGVRNILMNVQLPGIKADIDFVAIGPSIVVGEVKAGGGNSFLSYTSDGKIRTGRGRWIANGKSVRDQVEASARRLANYIGVQKHVVTQVICVTNASRKTLDVPWPGVVVCSKDMLRIALNQAKEAQFVDSPVGKSKIKTLMNTSVVVR